MKARKLLAVILSLVMVLGTMSTVVFADDPAVDNSAKIGDTEYVTFADAFAAAQTGDTITLLRDITEGGVVINNNLTLTIDLGGFTFTVGTLTVGSSAATATNGFQILKGCNVTIKNGTITSTTAKHLIQNYADLTLKNVTLDGSNLYYDEVGDAAKGQVPNTLSHNNGTLTIDKDSAVIGHKLGYAFDVSEWGSYSGATANVEEGATITGLVEIMNYGNKYGGDHGDGTTTSCKLTIGDTEVTTQGWYMQTGDTFKALYTPESGSTFNNAVSNADRPVMYNVTYKTNTNTEGTKTLYPANIKLAADPDDADEHMYFIGWECDDATCEDIHGVNSDYTLTKDVVFTAVYDSLPKHTLTFVPNGGKMDVKEIEAYEDEEIDLTDSAYRPKNSGYAFGGWYSSASLKTQVKKIKLTSDTKVYAKWTKNGGYGGGGSSSNSFSCLVKFDTNGGYTMQSTSVTYGKALAKPENPVKKGYIFKGWYSDSSLTKLYDFDAKVTKSMTLYAAWEKADAASQIILTIGQCDALVFGETVSNDVAPVIVNDRTMLPARFVAENMGANVEWDEANQLVTITGKHVRTGEDVVILITINSDIAYVNGNEVTLDNAAFIENDRTYTPLRFIVENLGGDIDWTEETSTVTITAKF